MTSSLQEMVEQYQTQTLIEEKASPHRQAERREGGDTHRQEASRKRITIPPFENSAGQKESEEGLSKNKYEDKAPMTVCTQKQQLAKKPKKTQKPLDIDTRHPKRQGKNRQSPQNTNKDRAKTKPTGHPQRHNNHKAHKTPTKTGQSQSPQDTQRQDNHKAHKTHPKTGQSQSPQDTHKDRTFTKPTRHPQRQNKHKTHKTPTKTGQTQSLQDTPQTGQTQSLQDTP